MQSINTAILGVLYHYGQGIAQNYQKAKEWYQKAADNGYSQANEVLKNFN